MTLFGLVKDLWFDSFIIIIIIGPSSVDRYAQFLLPVNSLVTAEIQSECANTCSEIGVLHWCKWRHRRWSCWSFVNQIPIDQRRSWLRVKKFETLCTDELRQFSHEVGSHGRAWIWCWTTGWKSNSRSGWCYKLLTKEIRQQGPIIFSDAVRRTQQLVQLRHACN